MEKSVEKLKKIKRSYYVICVLFFISIIVQPIIFIVLEEKLLLWTTILSFFNLIVFRFMYKTSSKKMKDELDEMRWKDHDKMIKIVNHRL